MRVTEVGLVAGKTVSLRLAPERLEWCDDYARRRGWTRTQVIEAALEALRGDVAGGVPDLPRDVAAAQRAAVADDPGAPRTVVVAESVRQLAMVRSSGEAKCRIPGCSHRGSVGSMCPEHRSSVLR